MISTIITAFVSFASTNIDDIFILTLFFSQINNDMKIKHIVIGQYLGIGLLTAISIIGALGVSVAPSEYVGFLGLVPIYLGVKAYFDYKKENKDNEDVSHQELQNNTSIRSIEIEETTYIQEKHTLNFARNFINPSAIKVFSLTLANGADNIGIYVPLFTSMNLMGIIVTVIIFILLIALWCFIALKLSGRSFVQKNIEKYKHIFVPIIFICIGVFILKESESISFVFKKIL